MAKKWLHLLFVLGHLFILIHCTYGEEEKRQDEGESHLTLESWVAALRAPAPAPRRHAQSSFSHRISGGGGNQNKQGTSDSTSDNGQALNENSRLKPDVSSLTEGTSGSGGHKGSVKSTANGSNGSHIDLVLENKNNSSDSRRVGGHSSLEVKKPVEGGDVNAPSPTSNTHDDKKRLHDGIISDKNLEAPVIHQQQEGSQHQGISKASRNEKEEVTSTSSTSVATARMLLVPDGSPSPSNLSANVDLLTWRLTDNNLLDEIADNIMASGDRNSNPNPNRSGELEDSLKAKFSNAASEVVETRVLPPGHLRKESRKPACGEQNSWGCLTLKERIQLRQKLMKDLETSYNVPLPSRIRYRLKKKPSVYTSKKPNIRFDLGIPDIYETEVQVTPKYRRKPPEERQTVGYPEEEYRFAADRSHHHYLPTPSGPSYVPLGALATPAYSGIDASPVTKSYIPLNRNFAEEQSGGLVFRPPRRPPGINRRRTDGLLLRPTPGKPHFFTPAPNRVSLQAHLQYRRPVSFKYKRTGGDYHENTPNGPTTRIYTTEPYPRPTFVAATVSPHHETKTTHHHEVTSKGYSKPPEKYIPPTKEYVPPKVPHPTPALGVDHSKIVPPNKEYLTPKHTSPTPVSYTEPSQKYVPPSKEYVTTSKEHGPSVGTHKPVLHPHAEPPTKYIPPDTEYSAPQKPHGPVPPTSYEPPSKEYIPPKPPHHIPKSPHKEYDEPPRKYHPPNKEYIAPPHRPKHAEGYSPPPRKYIPPDKPYLAGHRGPGKGSPHRRRRPGKRRRKHRKRPTPPTQSYLLPNKEYGHENKEPLKYNVPETNYVPPNKEYIPPKVDKPGHTHSVPVATVSPVSYATPARTYIPPVEEYVAPQKHTTPSSAYEPPSNEYVPPLPPKSTPKHHEAPKPTYGPPLQTYELPTLDYAAGPPKPEPHDTGLPSWLMSLQGKTPAVVEKPKPYAINPTPPPGYHPKHSTRQQHSSREHHSPLADHHTTPIPGYHAPEPTYGPPKKDHHIPEVTYIPPNHDYKPPDHIHSPPKPGYHAPEPTYGPPKLDHYTPEPTYAPPRKDDHPPVTYIPPEHDYKVPDHVHSSPKPGYHAPEPTYGPPKPGYHAPHPTYAAPKKDYHIPEDRYIPPKHDFQILDQVLSSPKPGYHAPEPTYGPPKIDYHVPEDTYVPPNVDYHAPLHPSSPKPGYHAPDPTYSPRKPSHHSPVPAYVPPRPDPHVHGPPHSAPIIEYPVPENKYVPPKNEYKPPEYVHAPELAYSPPHKETSYGTPKPGYHAPEPTYGTPKPGYHAPEPPYLPPKGDHPIMAHPRHPGYHAPEPTYKPPVYEHHEPGYHAPKPTYKPTVHHVTTLSPSYAPPLQTYVPPVKEYLPPKDYHVTPAYVPPKPPLEAHALKEAYVPPALPEVTIPKTPYHPPPPPPLHLPIDVNYLPPVKEPSPNYLLPNQEYLAPAPHEIHSTPHPVEMRIKHTLSTIHSTVPELAYVPPVTPKPHIATVTALALPVKTTAKPDYVAPAPPKQEYIPPPSITIAPYDPPLKIPGPHHVTTYKPNSNAKVQKLQEFSYPGTGKVSPATPLPYTNASTTYAPPVYTPTTYGPGYNDLPPSVKPSHRPPLAELIADYDDYYYYYDDDYDDDYYYYYDDGDDDDYYYYYYDDYDYELSQLRQPVPHHLIPHSDYDILDNEIKDFGYIAGIPGRAGRDYPILSYIPLTSFGCDLVADYPGYYADMEAGCQVFHICHRSGRQDSFLCPNGTVFNQKYFVCDWWYNFACEDAPFFYPVNAALGHPGVPLHRNAFEPDLEAARQLPPLERRSSIYNQVTPLPFLQHS